MIIPILLLSVAAPGALTADVPLLERSTSKSASAFGSCFASVQQARSQALWFVPFETGGASISNEGTLGVANPFRIRVVEASGRTEISASISNRDGTENRLETDIKSCL